MTVKLKRQQNPCTAEKTCVNEAGILNRSEGHSAVSTRQSSEAAWPRIEPDTTVSQSENLIHPRLQLWFSHPPLSFSPPLLLFELFRLMELLRQLGDREAMCCGVSMAHFLSVICTYITSYSQPQGQHGH